MNRIALSPSLIIMIFPCTPWSSRALRTNPASAGLSSTRRIEADIGAKSPSSFSGRDRKVKCRTASWTGIHPDASAGALDNPLADSEAHAGARIVGCTVKTFKDFKNLLLILGIDPDTVVLNGEQPVPTLQSCRH